MNPGRNVLPPLFSRLAWKSCYWRTRIQITPKWSTKLAANATFKITCTHIASRLWNLIIICLIYLYLVSCNIFFFSFFFCLFGNAPLYYVSLSFCHYFFSSRAPCFVRVVNAQKEKWIWTVEDGTVQLIRSQPVCVLSSYHLAALFCPLPPFLLCCSRMGKKPTNNLVYSSDSESIYLSNAKANTRIYLYESISLFSAGKI